MGRRATLGLVSVFLFFAAFPLTLVKPGLPQTFKADEAAYYMMAQSLAHDRDLRLTAGDAERVFVEFPYRPVKNLILMTDDGWRTAYYGKPYLYSLFAAPLVGLRGADGMLWFNVLLTVGMVALGAVWLGRFDDGGPAALFSAGFFLVGTGFGYAFWLQPEVFNMAGVTAALFFGLDRGRPPGEAGAGRGRWRPQGALAAALSGAALALAVYNKPMLAALGLPVVVDLARRRLWRSVAAWIGGVALTLAAAAGLSLALTGHPTPYLGVERQGVTLCEPGVMPIGPGPAGGAAPREERATGGAWSWIFRLPEVAPRELAANLGYFLWGRHTGLLLYFPFVLPALALFLLHGRRSPTRWALVAALGAVALFFLLFIPENWQGGGGFIGNRYFVAAVPGFLFLVTRIRPRWLIPAGYLLGGLLLGPLLLSPFERAGPEPTLQSHVRNAPFGLFPLELSLREVPGYYRFEFGDYSVVGRKDVTLPRGERAWVAAGLPVELWLLGERPLARAVFQVKSFAPDNRIQLELGNAREERVLGAGETARIELSPGEPDRVRRRRGRVQYGHRLVVEAARARIQHWTRHFPPDRCAPYFPDNESWEEGFPAGLELTYLGSGEGLDRDLYAVRWIEVRVPGRVTAGEEFAVDVRLANASDNPWIAEGAARVRLAYHWWTVPAEEAGDSGEMVLRDGERTELPLPVPPGGELAVAQRVFAPERPGRYVLELDLVFEQVAWFSDRDPGSVYRTEVEVTAAGGRPRPGGAGGESADAATGGGTGGGPRE